MRITKKNFKDALIGTYGIQSSIAQKLGVSRSAITQFLNKYPDMKTLCEEEREKIIDIAENRLFKALNEGEQWAINKTLSTLGKRRGYVEKTELEHSGSAKIEIITNIPPEVKGLLGEQNVQ